MANRHKQFAKGGKVTKEVNSKVESEAEDKHDGFKKGGAAKHAAGGKVVGRARGGRLDKRARGGGVGKSPFSSAHVKPTMAAGNPAVHKG